MSNKRQKKLMLLGGLRYLLPVIEAAHKQGYYVITADYLPDNIAHKYSDEYCNVSIIDKEAVLKEAKRLQIDGIMSFAVDPGVTAAAYVAEKMGLPFQCSYESACILQNKSKFRSFLAENGFNVPFVKCYANIKDAIEDTNLFQFPLMVKPVDSAGSKGVSKVDSEESLQSAIENALNESHIGHFIVEGYLEKVGYSSDSDCFTIDGDLCYCSFSDQMFDADADNPFTPAAYVWPSSMPVSVQDELKSELQRLMRLLNVGTGVFNVETRLCSDGKPYIMEVSPRGGGNRLSEMLGSITSTNLIDNAVRASVGDPVDAIAQPDYQGYLAEVILHSRKCGKFKNVIIDKTICDNHLIEKDLWVKEGDDVETFSGANKAIGTISLKADSRKSLDMIMNGIGDFVKVDVD